MLFNFFMATAFAEEKAAGGNPPPPNALMQFLPLIMIGLVFYFLILKPQKKKMQTEQEMLKQLQKGDEIVTKSGLLGKIVGLTDKIVTLELEEGTKVKFLRNQIAGKSVNFLTEENKK